MTRFTHLKRTTGLLASLASALTLPADAAARTLNDFDLSGALIPVEDIHPGGPPRDGIPAIDQPRFIEAAAARFLRRDDPVVSVTVGDETRAYPLRILVWHEIVNDTIGDLAIAVTYCPLCGTAMVFERQQGERTLSFGVSGLLYQSDVLMYDRQTVSLWSQLASKAVAGPLKGRTLRWLPSEHMTWEAWRRRHPQGLVLSTDTGHRRDYAGTPYEGYEDTERTMFPVPRHRNELSNKEWIAGIVFEGRANAYRVHSLPDGQWVDDTVGGTAIRVRYSRRDRHFAAKLAADESPVPSVLAYWFAWQAFHPDTELR